MLPFSKNEAVPKQRLKHKEAPKFSREAVDIIGTVRGFRSSPKSKSDCLNQEAAGRQGFAGVNCARHGHLGCSRVASEKRAVRKDISRALGIVSIAIKRSFRRPAVETHPAPR